MEFKINKLKNKPNTYNLIGNEDKNFFQIKLFPRLKEYKFRKNLLYKSTSNWNEEISFLNKFLDDKGFEPWGDLIK